MFKANGRYLPCGKESIAAWAIDATAGDLLRALYRTPDLAARFRLADELGRHVLDAAGFFEWESQLELFLSEEKEETEIKRLGDGRTTACVSLPSLNPLISVFLLKFVVNALRKHQT
ncbi:MAG: hypothetical protein R2851_25100 [Caldilineaceae bacterium]